MNGIGIDINGVNPVAAPAVTTVAQPTPFDIHAVAQAAPTVTTAEIVAPVTFAMPTMPGGIVNTTTTSTAPLEAPSTMVMNTTPGVTPVESVVGIAPSPEVIAQLAAQQNPTYAPAPAPIASAPAPVEEVAAPAPAPIASVINTPAPSTTIATTINPVMDAANLAALGIEDTQVHPTVLPVVETPVQTLAPLSAAEQNGLVSRMSTPQFDNFIKILEAVNSDSNCLINQINNGIITLLREGGQLTTKIDHIFGTNNWVLNNPAVQLKRLKFAKAEAETIIIDDGTCDNLISKNNKGEITGVTKLTKIDSEYMPQTLSKDYGERKHSVQVQKDIIKNLVDARASYEKSTYNITIDANTYEIIKLHLGDDYIRNILGEEGRVLKTYVVTQLFPIVGEALISVYLNDRGEVSFKSSVDIYNATISFHIGADEFVKSVITNINI